VCSSCCVCVLVVFVCARCVVCVVVVSLGGNCIGDQGAAAIGAGLHGLPLLTSLEYVMQAWGDVCDGERTGGVE
jgi:hypothetical protein